MKYILSDDNFFSFGIKSFSEENSIETRVIYCDELFFNPTIVLNDECVVIVDLMCKITRVRIVAFLLEYEVNVILVNSGRHLHTQRGLFYNVSKKINTSMIKSIFHLPKVQRKTYLTPREKTVFHLLMTGSTVAMIAEQLLCSTRTVYSFKYSIVEKFGIGSFNHPILV